MIWKFKLYIFIKGIYQNLFSKNKVDDDTDKSSLEK